ncbi:MAG: hypothetical protein QOF89_4928 [Acidobacteriota bacterium]|jgi:hypothetical protein|nr:hypothetical protein [Acidobacteriota bacterium]
MLAAELMLLRINWEERDPQIILGTQDQKRVQEIIQLYRKISGHAAKLAGARPKLTRSRNALANSVAALARGE